MLSRLIAEIWEHDDKGQEKRADDRDGCKQANSLARLYKPLYLEVKKESAPVVLVITPHRTGKLCAYKCGKCGWLICGLVYNLSDCLTAHVHALDFIATFPDLSN